MEFKRYLHDRLEAQIGKQKVLMLYGSRRTGKTTIIENIHENHQRESLILLGEDIQVQCKRIRYSDQATETVGLAGRKSGQYSRTWKQSSDQ